MRTTFLRNLWAALAVALLAFTNAFAQTALQFVTGYDGTDGATTLTPSAVGADGSYTITLSKQIGVAFSASVAGAGQFYRGPVQDKPTQQSVWLYAIPNGSTVYAMGLGSQWGTMSKDLGQVDVTKAKASGAINGGTVTLRFARSAKPCEMVNFVVVTPANGRFWGSHPDHNSAWVIPNVADSPRTGWCVRDNQVVTVDQFDPQIRVALKTKE